MTVTVTADCCHLTVNQTEQPYIILFIYSDQICKNVHSLNIHIFNFDYS